MAGKKHKKPGKGKEKTDRKTAKAAEKRARRDDKKINEEDDIDAILASIQKEAAKKVAIQIDENVPAPSPRCNCSLTVNPTKETELILYGGEFYNGDKTYVYGDLYRYNVERGDWKLISSPNSPPPRSAHQAVGWKNSIFVFGGEFTSPNQERFHHYKDLWRFDLSTNAWEQLQLKGCPSPRSGHRMVLYKHKLILFGGFYDTLREVRYFNDLHVLDLDEYKWQEIKPKLASSWPSPRSGFNFAVCLDEVFLYGGYFKDSAADKDGPEKGMVHADMWVLDPRTWEWNKVKKLGMPPGPRAGFSLCTHKKRAILFGGVVDTEEQGDLLHSTFLNELYAFQMDNRRWYPLELRKAKVPKQKSRGKASMDEDPDGDENKRKAEFKSFGGAPRQSEDIEWNGIVTENEDVLDLSASNNVGKMEGQHSGYYDKLAARVERTFLDEGVLETDFQSIDSGGATKKDGKFDVPSTSAIHQVVRPCGRINAGMVVGRDTLFLYGGLMEVGDQEVTLDDLYSLDLNKLDEWRCLIEASKSEWVEPDEEDEDENEDTDSEDGMDTDTDSSDDDIDDVDCDDDGKKNVLSAVEETAALLRGEGKKMLRKERKIKIEQLQSELGLADLQRTPKSGESLKDFFARSNMYWQMAAYEHTQHTGKELRKDGFDLAETRYKELKPVLDELAKLEAEQKAEEDTQILKSNKMKEKARHTNGHR